MGCERKNLLTRWATLAIILLGIFLMTGATAYEANEKNSLGRTWPRRLRLPRSPNRNLFAGTATF